MIYYINISSVSDEVLVQIQHWLSYFITFLAPDNGEIRLRILLDLSKAFDTV